MVQVSTAAVAARFAETQVLIVDDDASVRKVVKAMLTSMGVGVIWEAGDGVAGLDIVRKSGADAVILDWEMPRMEGPDFMRILRSPDTFPHPAVPVIMLTAHSEYSKVKEAISVGVNEFLLKPVSSKALLARMVSVLFNPRPIVRKRDYYGPQPRTASDLMKQTDWTNQDLVML
ncbi:MAG: response regulator [Pseudolabrys sp.]|jgi:CheY-like chemotaxis protein